MHDKLEWAHFITIIERVIEEVRQRNYETFDRISDLAEEYMNKAAKITINEKNRIEQIYRVLNDLLDNKIEEDQQRYLEEMKILNQYQKYLNPPVLNQNYLSIWR